MPEAIAAPPPKPTVPPPTPRPSSPPPRPPMPKPAPPKPEESGALDDSFAELDRIDSKDAASKALQKPDKKPAKQDERKSSEEDNAGDIDEVPEDEAKPEKEAKADENAKSGEESDAKPVRAAELRTAYEKAKGSLKEKDAEITRLKGELETKAKTEDPDKKILVERLTTTEKKLKEYEDELRFTNYKNHPEFKEKYEAPYHSAMARAVHDFEQISVVDDEGNKRPATRKDLDLMLSIPIGNVDDIAAEKFGHSAARVVRHVEKLRDLADAYNGAIEDAKTKGGEREKTKAVEFQQQNEQRHKLWKEANEEIAKKYPKLLSLKDGDDEYNKALETGTALADSVFMHRDKVDPSKIINLDAEAYVRLRGHDRLVMVAKRRSAKIAELEKALKEYEASDPSSEGDEPPKKEDGGNWEDNAFAELDAIDRKSRK